MGYQMGWLNVEDFTTTTTAFTLPYSTTHGYGQIQNAFITFVNADLSFRNFSDFALDATSDTTPRIVQPQTTYVKQTVLTFVLVLLKRFPRHVQCQVYIV